MNINAINNNQPSFGMAFKVTNMAQDMLSTAIKSSDEIANIAALQDMFGPAKDTLFIKAAVESKKPKNFLSRIIWSIASRNKLRVNYTKSDGFGRINEVKASHLVKAKKFIQDPRPHLREFGGRPMELAFDASREAVFENLKTKALTSILPD